MATLLLRLAAPMQSWGVSSVFSDRYAGTEPSKSGVIGMVAAAMGRERSEPVSDLAALRFGVRIDQPGGIVRDYHTAKHPEKDKLAFVTNRWYITDAVFLAGLEGDRNMLTEIDEAIRNPVFPLYLGRRSCPPTGQVSLGIRDAPLKEALENEEWQASEWYRKKLGTVPSLEIVYDVPFNDNGATVRDVPESFSTDRRTFSFRKTARERIEKQPEEFETVETDHDPFKCVKEE